MKPHYLSLLTLLLIFCALSCDVEKKSEELEESAENVDDNIKAENEILRIFDNVNNYGVNKKQKSVKNASTDEKPEQIWEENTLILDFSNIDNMQGKIIAEFNEDPEIKEGLSIDLTFDSFVDRDIEVSGNMLVRIEQVLDNEKVVYSITTNDKLTFGMGLTFTWKINQTFEWFEGVNTPLDNTDDAFNLNGTAQQLTDNNKLSLIDIYYSNDCDYLRSGELQFYEDNDDDPVICNFGVDANGNSTTNCNSFALISKEGLTINYDFHR